MFNSGVFNIFLYNGTSSKDKTYSADFPMAGMLILATSKIGVTDEQIPMLTRQEIVNIGKADFDVKPGVKIKKARM